VKDATCGGMKKESTTNILADWHHVAAKPMVV